MSKPKIKFSHDYPKLWNQDEAYLLAIKKIHSDNISDELREYDTAYYPPDDSAKPVMSYYDLPHGLLLQLIFIGNKGIPFCTIRRYTRQKYEYYLKNIRKFFFVEIHEKMGGGD